MEQPSHCLNCGAELRGPYCHACGQPVKGMVRHLRSILQDFLDTVLEYDSRIWRTLLPLYFRPGRITLEFLAGKRMRTVPPFRLFFVLTVVTFLVLQLVVDPTPDGTSAAASSIQDATTVAEVETDATERTVRGVAEDRIERLEKAEAAPAEGREPPPAQPGLIFDGEAWDAETNPLEVAWLPDAANAALNRWIGRAERNIQLARDDPGRLLESFLGLLPAALFVLTPLFALLLAVFYLGRRWLYTAHLVVALHSHSFLVMALLVTALLDALTDALQSAAWPAYPLRFLTVASQLWMPVYLVLMQRRVYTQGWLVTLLKFGLIGIIYVVILIFAVTAVALVSLVTA